MSIWMQIYSGFVHRINYNFGEWQMWLLMIGNKIMYSLITYKNLHGWGSSFWWKDLKFHVCKICIQNKYMCHNTKVSIVTPISMDKCWFLSFEYIKATLPTTKSASLLIIPKRKNQHLWHKCKSFCSQLLSATFTYLLVWVQMLLSCT